LGRLQGITLRKIGKSVEEPGCFDVEMDRHVPVVSFCKIVPKRAEGDMDAFKEFDQYDRLGRVGVQAGFCPQPGVLNP
jgi:hypothetical protein